MDSNAATTLSVIARPYYSSEVIFLGLVNHVGILIHLCTFQIEQPREVVVEKMRGLLKIWSSKQYLLMNEAKHPSEHVNTRGTNCYGFVEASLHLFQLELPPELQKRAGTAKPNGWHQATCSEASKKKLKSIFETFYQSRENKENDKKSIPVLFFFNHKTEKKKTKSSSQGQGDEEKPEKKHEVFGYLHVYSEDLVDLGRELGELAGLLSSSTSPPAEQVQTVKNKLKQTMISVKHNYCHTLPPLKVLTFDQIIDDIPMQSTFESMINHIYERTCSQLAVIEHVPKEVAQLLRDTYKSSPEVLAKMVEGYLHLMDKSTVLRDTRATQAVMLFHKLKPLINLVALLCLTHKVINRLSLSNQDDILQIYKKEIEPQLAQFYNDWFTHDNLITFEYERVYQTIDAIQDLMRLVHPPFKRIRLAVQTSKKMGTLSRIVHVGMYLTTMSLFGSLIYQQSKQNTVSRATLLGAVGTTGLLSLWNTVQGYKETTMDQVNSLFMTYFLVYPVPEA